MTSKPLVWNFSLHDDSNPVSRIDFQSFEPDSKVKWEQRFFWTQDSTIEISGLSHDFLHLAKYQFKTRQDTYILKEPDKPNIKLRNHKIAYKPFLCVEDQVYGYAKKQKFEPSDPKLIQLLPKLEGWDQTSSIETYLPKHYPLVETYKEAFILELDHKLKAKVEFARMTLQAHPFYSFCIEAKSKALVKHIRAQMLNHSTPISYPQFIENQLS